MSAGVTGLVFIFLQSAQFSVNSKKYLYCSVLNIILVLDDHAVYKIVSGVLKC